MRARRRSRASWEAFVCSCSWIGLVSFLAQWARSEHFGFVHYCIGSADMGSTAHASSLRQCWLTALSWFVIAAKSNKKAWPSVAKLCLSPSIEPMLELGCTDGIGTTTYGVSSPQTKDVPLVVVPFVGPLVFMAAAAAVQARPAAGSRARSGSPPPPRSCHPAQSGGATEPSETGAGPDPLSGSWWP